MPAACEPMDEYIVQELPGFSFLAGRHMPSIVDMPVGMPWRLSSPWRPITEEAKTFDGDPEMRGWLGRGVGNLGGGWSASGLGIKRSKGTLLE